jgi:Skp family chaperone for outer membrane proteins
MTVNRWIVGVMAGLLLSAPVTLSPAYAQAGGATPTDTAPMRVGVCNPAKVFEQLEERKTIQDRMTGERARLQEESNRKKGEVQDLMKQRDGMKPGSQLYDEKNTQVLNLTVNYEVWARMTEASLARQEKDQIIGLFDRIRDATREIANERKFDLVLAEHRPEIPADRDKLNPDQVRALIGQNDVLFSNERVDVTAAVVQRMNQKYLAGGGTPAGAGAGTTSPAAGGTGTAPAGTGAGTPPKRP